MVSVKNARGEDMQDEEYSTVYEAQDGNSLVLSIDENIQQSLETHLSAAITEYGVKNRGAGIVMDVNTGEILAMAVEPSYDLNDPFTITDPVILEELEAITDKGGARTGKDKCAVAARVAQQKRCRIHTFPALCSK